VLVVYLKTFTADQVVLLQSWADSVKVWPRTYSEQYLENEPVDYWMEFTDGRLLDIWLLQYAEDSRIMRTLFD